MLSCNGLQCFGVRIKLFLGIGKVDQCQNRYHHALVAGGQIIQHFAGFLALLL